MSRQSHVVFLVTFLGAACVVPCSSHASGRRAGERRPNILFIYTDDQSHRTLSCYPEAHPWVRTPNIDRLAHQGVRFSYAYGQAWCAPSRASVMTGLHPHGIQGLRLEGFGGYQDPQICRFWPAALRRGGYKTALIGKWHITFDIGHGRDWDYSVVWQQGDRRGDWYNNQLISINGGPKKTMPGYSTDVYTRYAVDYIQREHEKPWFMWLCYNAPHLPNTVHPRHQNRYEDMDVPIPSDIFGPRPDKPRYMLDFTMFRHTGSMKDVRVSKSGYPRCPYPIQTLPEFVRGYHQLICAVDEGVGRILEALEATGQLDNTLIVYTSDQGFAWGQHGYANKIGPHEACMRMPLIVRLPGRVAQGEVCNHPISLVDLPPTFLACAGVELPWRMHGHGLRPILENPGAEWEHPALVEHFLRAFGDDTYHPLKGQKQRQRHGIPWWISLRQGKYKYIRTLVADEVEELYDLQADPGELKNLALEAAYQAVLMDHRRRLIDELKRTNAGLVENLPAPRLATTASGKR